MWVGSAVQRSVPKETDTTVLPRHTRWVTHTGPGLACVMSENLLNTQSGTKPFWFLLV